MPDKKILIVEDEVAIGKALEVRLTSLGYTPIVVHDGRSGLQAAAQHKPHVAVMDIRLPDMDGIEACRRMKDDPQLSEIPVLFLSANVNDVARGEAAEVGALACLAKPYEIQDLTAAIDSALKISHYSEAS